jgi:hypothetical protein
MTKPGLPQHPEHEKDPFPAEPQTRPDTPSTLPPPERKLRCHKCCHEKAVQREVVLEGTAPGRWLPAREGEEGAFCDPDGRWQRWHKTGKEAKFTVHVHELAPGDAEKISHVTTRFGHLPRDFGVVHWTVDDNGHLVVRPALPDHDLDLQVHIDDGGQDG